MRKHTIRKRTRYFLAVEGESEQAFVTWLHILSGNELHVHLDSHPLGGGGFKSMLEKAVALHERRRKAKGAYRNRFLIVDGDRAGQGDWSVEKLRSEAAKHEIIVCVQWPNHEGLLLRMTPGMESEVPDAETAEAELKRCWPGYQKPVNAHALKRRFSLDDLLRVANVDTDLGILLKAIGLMTE
jgi:hypothetical protein